MFIPSPSQISINENEYLLFKKYFTENCGIVIPPEKRYLLETRLSRFMVDAGTENFSGLYDFLNSNSDPSLPQKIINAITTNETQWFRDISPWKVLEERLLPGLINDVASGKKACVKIWSAAVSTGQEIYSTVMCVDNYLKKNNIKDVTLSDFYFFATDISSRVLDIAKKGRYDKISIMRGLDGYYKTAYFTDNTEAWDIDPAIRKAVKFECFNLQDSFKNFGMFDIIFCRYVLIYFSDALKKEIVSKMHDVLLKKGVIFTGNYILYDLFSGNFDSGNYGNLTYYTKKAGLP